MISSAANQQSRFDVSSVLEGQSRPAWRTCLITDNKAASDDIIEMLASGHAVSCANPAPGFPIDWSGADAFVIDAGRKTAEDMLELSRLVASAARLSKPVFIVLGPTMRLLAARVGLLVGVNALTRPLSTTTFVDVLDLLLEANAKSHGADRSHLRRLIGRSENVEAISAADDAMDRIFAAGLTRDRLDYGVIESRASTIIDTLGDSGIGAWISDVRRHHDQTYQHCLLVTGIAVAFGHQLRMGRDDMRRIAIGALMHDIGKAHIPLGILDKPAELNPDEMAIMRRHPEFGVAILRSQRHLPKEITDIVLNHHEYLNGSGYPNGLTAAEIPDIVRLITIADVLGALIEQRSYRAPMTGKEAYDVLLAMGSKLDADIVRAIRPTAFKATG